MLRFLTDDDVLMSLSDGFSWNEAVLVSLFGRALEGLAFLTGIFGGLSKAL